MKGKRWKLGIEVFFSEVRRRNRPIKSGMVGGGEHGALFFLTMRRA